MWPAVYKHSNSRTERDAINTASSDSERPGPRWPQPHLASGLSGGNTLCTGPRVKTNATPRERAGRTYCVSGWLRPCVRRPTCYVTEFWQLAHEANAARQSRAASRAAAPLAARHAPPPPINTWTPTARQAASHARPFVRPVPHAPTALRVITRRLFTFLNDFLI